MLKVILTGGGTGGHVNPALAIADVIKTHEPDSEIIFIGTKKGIENRLVGKEGYGIRHVEARGFDRANKLSPKNLIAAWYFLMSPVKAKKIIKDFSPDIVIGTGGYVSYAPIKAAAKLGIPTAVHESNAIPGLAVRLVQHDVDKILLNFESSMERLEAKEKVKVVGNPLRGSFGKFTKEEARRELGINDDHKFVILSFGGSLGAPAINGAALEIMNKFVKNRPDVLHIHATGKERYAEFEEEFKELGLDKYENIKVSDYVYDMPKKLAAADLVISRAGAMTVTEMARMKKPCIMIPSPYVAENHQYKNAKVLADANAVVLIEEKELENVGIARKTEELLEDKARLASMSQNISAFAGENSCELIYREIKKLIDKK